MQGLGLIKWEEIGDRSAGMPNETLFKFVSKLSAGLIEVQSADSTVKTVVPSHTFISLDEVMIQEETFDIGNMVYINQTINRLPSDLYPMVGSRYEAMGKVVNVRTSPSGRLTSYHVRFPSGANAWFSSTELSLRKNINNEKTTVVDKEGSVISGTTLVKHGNNDYYNDGVFYIHKNLIEECTTQDN